MEESYETFEEELWPPRADPPPPHKPVRQTRRPEMFAARKTREEAPAVSLQPKSEPKVLPREPSVARMASPPAAPSVPSLSQPETPWENVTLNRCLFVAITILVLTSGFQRLNEGLRGPRAAEEEEEVRLAVRRTGALRHRGQPLEPETSLWDVMFWWLPDLDDDDDDEDDEEEEEDGAAAVRAAKAKRGARAKAASGLRNKPLSDKKLMKKRDGKLKERRDKKAKKEEEEQEEEEEEENEEEEEEEEEEAPKKSKKEKKEKKKNRKR